MKLNQEKLGVGVTIGTGTNDFNVIAKHLELAETQDLQFVEFSIYDWNIIIGKRIIPQELRKFKSICERTKLKFAIHGELSVNFFDLDNIQDHKEVLKRDIEISSSVGALHLVTHFGSTSEETFRNKKKYEDLLKIQREAYTEMGDYAKSHNVILVVENLFSFFKNHYAPLPSVVANELFNINHPNVKATLDFSHAFINCNQLKVDFLEEIKKMSPISKHLHVHDSFGNSKNIWTYNESEELSYGLGDLHLPIGWGSIPFEEIFNLLEFPKGLILNLEIQEKFIEYIPETIKRAKYFLDKVIICK